MSFEQQHIHPFVGNDPETDIILFFTDNNSEPKKLNVRRAIEGDEQFTGNALGYEGEDLEDFIMACPKSPTTPVSFEFSLDYAQDGGSIESAFKNSDGIIFSYQNIDGDGFVSSPAAFSEVAHPPSVFNLGTLSISDVTVENTCNISIPRQTQETSRVRLLFKEGDAGVWKIIDEVSTKVEQSNELFSFTPDNDEFVGVYKFRMDRVYAVLPADESKNFDNLPQAAESQTVSGNRLKYGNYKEGFDNVNARARSQVILNERPQDLTAFSLDAKPIFTQNELSDEYSGNEGASTGFLLDGSSLPENITSGTYQVQINVKPARNIHVYDTKNKGYRGSKNISTSEDALDFSAQLPEIQHGSGVFTDYQSYYASEGTEDTPMFSNNSSAATAYWRSETEFPVFETKLGSTASAPIILDINNIFVKLSIEVQSESISRSQFMSGISSVLSPNFENTNALASFGMELLSVNGIPDYDVTYGVFSDAIVNLGLNSGDKINQTQALSQLICAAPRETTNRPAGFFIFNKANVKVGFESSSEFDTADGTKKGFSLKVVNITDTEIFTCFPKPSVGSGSHPIILDEDGGILNFLGDLFSGGSANTGETGTFYNGELKPWTIYKNVEDGESFVPKVFWPKKSAELYGEGSTRKIPYRIGEWLVLDKEAVQAEEWSDYYAETYENLDGTDLGDLVDANTFTFVCTETASIMGNFTLPFAETPNLDDISTTDSPSYFWQGWIEGFEFSDSELDPDNDDFTGFPLVKQTLSVVDGNAGPGGMRDISTPFSDTALNAQGAPEANEQPGPVPGGTWQEFTQSNQLGSQNYPTSNRYGSIWGSSLVGYVDNMPFINTKKTYRDVTSQENQSSVNPLKKDAFDSSPVNVIDVSSSAGLSGGSTPSFKTRATHDFGIVYYDKRGRAGAVNKLASVYVPGYSSEERPSGEVGAVDIKLTLLNEPPTWATDFKIVYSNRNNVRRFIQYTAADAFTKKGTNASKGKIYISLAHLQSNDISYAESYGARTSDTDEPTLYRYSSGDTLRILSYYSDETTRVWAGDDYVFDVLGVETLSNSMEDHPLYEDAEADEEKKLQRNGDFVVVRNNAQATGFTSSNIDADNDLWKNRVVIEIVSPEKETIDVAQPYFETSYGGKVVSGQHDNNVFIIKEGDVFFRSVPLNVQDYDSDTSSFVNRIKADTEGNDVSQPNFDNYFLETDTATDLYSSAAKGYGKAHFVNPDAREQRQESSITFSQKTTPSDFKIKYTSFPPNTQNSFHLPERYGAVNYLVGKDEYVTALQESKVSMIPLERAITSTATGEKTLNLSDSVLNAGTFFEQDYGAAGNPESVIVVDGKVYFADKNNKLIISVSKSEGMRIISQSGMEEYFKRQFDELLASDPSLEKKHIRIVAGYDPEEGEVIFSFIKPGASQLLYNGFTNENPVLTQFGPSQDFIHDENPQFVNTIAFDHQGGKFWKTRYSYSSTNYARVNNKFVSFNHVGSNFVWEHGVNEKRNSFHGVNYYSMIKTASTFKSASMNKEFRALSFEGNQAWPSIVRTTNEKAKVGSFNELEEGFYSDIKGSEGSTTTSNVMTVGLVKSAGFAVATQDILGLLQSGEPVPFDIEFESPVNRYPVNLGSHIDVRYTNPGGNVAQSIGLTPVKIMDSHTIRYTVSGSSTAEVPEGAKIIHIANSAVYGDTPRGKSLEITSYNNSTEPVELFAINVEGIPSKLDASS